MTDILSNHDQSVFHDENGKVLHHTEIDRKKQLDALMYIPSDSCVLEIGSSYGIVSCLINNILKNPKNHLVLEKKNIGQFQICNDLSLTLKELEDKYSLKFDVIIANCEESLFSFLQDDLSKIKIMILGPLCSCKHERVQEHLRKFGFDCLRSNDRTIYVNNNFLPFSINSYYAPDGNIGIFGQLGQINKSTVLSTDGIELCSIALHAPSRLEIETKRELLVRGYASPTAEDCPILYFKVNDCQIGDVCKAGSKTVSYRLLPGKHVLGIHPSIVSWAHSVWLFEESKKSELSYGDIQKYFKIDINSTERGLVNQLINLINGITLSNGRHIYNPHFFPNYNSTDWIPLSDIFDIDRLNIMFESYTKIIIDKTIDQKEWIKPDYYNNLCSRNSRAKISDILSKEDYPYLDLGDVFSVMLDRNSRIEKIEFEFYKNIPFIPEFGSVLKYIKDNFLRDQYNVLHLRLEDDFVSPYAVYYGRDCEEYTKILLTRYFNAMSKMFKPEDKIYIATHLLKKDYPNNYVIDLIREKYPNIITVIPWREQFNLPQGREIDAIIDYLISINNEKFIGIHGSTFSILINKINKSKGNESYLINSYAY
jgi:hypothetical protein